MGEVEGLQPQEPWSSRAHHHKLPRSNSSMPRLLFLVPLLLLAACGQPPTQSTATLTLSPTTVSFSPSFAPVSGMKAKVTISGVGTFPMTVLSTGSVTATIPNVPVGDHTITITYYITDAQGDLTLAQATLTAMVSANQTTTTAVASTQVDRSFDADGDGATNLIEAQAGTGVRDPTSKPADLTPPSVPTGLTATAASSSQINLAWTASTDNVGVTTYRVFRGGTLAVTATTTSHSDTGLTAATTYTYTVSACDAVGNCSAKSASASATTPVANVGDTAAPAVPTGLTAEAVGSNQVNLSWAAATDDVAVTSYKVFRAGIQVATVTTTSYTDTGLTASTSYTYTASACDAAGNCSAQSSQVNVTTLSALTPTVTFALDLTVVGSGTITSTPAGITCSSNPTADSVGCTEAYESDTAVTLTASSATGSTFTGWSGACTGTSTCTVTMAADKSVTATFTAISGLILSQSGTIDSAIDTDLFTFSGTADQVIVLAVGEEPGGTT